MSATPSFSVYMYVKGIVPSSGSGFEEVDPDDCVTMVQLAIQKCLEKEALCNEFYLQLIKQTTDQPDPNGRINIQNWRFLCLVCGVVVPRNRVILNYLQAHLRRCGLDSHTEEGKFAQFAMQVNNTWGCGRVDRVRVGRKRKMVTNKLSYYVCYIVSLKDSSDKE